VRKKTIVFFVLNIYKSGGIERVVTEISNRLCNNYDIIILSMFKTDEKPYFELNSSIKHQFIFNKEFNLRYKYLYVRKILNVIILLIVVWAMYHLLFLPEKNQFIFLGNTQIV
jgi:hypothetical protein